MAQRPISAVTRSAGLLWRRQALARERGQEVERARALEEFAQLVGETLQGHPHFERRRGDPEVQKLLRQLEQAREALSEMSAADEGGAGDGDEEENGAERKAEVQAWNFCPKYPWRRFVGLFGAVMEPLPACLQPARP